MTNEAGRRSAVRRSLSPTALLGVLIPLLTVGALSLVRPDPVVVADRPAEQVRPSRIDLACPSALDRTRLSVAAAGGEVDGTVSRSSGNADPEPVDLATDRVTEVTSRQPTLLQGRGPVAAELIGSRFETDGLAAAECLPPEAEAWLTGLGAGAEHSSVLELTNPDDGPAVADITVWGSGGPVAAPTLRGLIVPGGSTTRLDLSDEVPRRGELTIRVEVPRGRLVPSVEDALPAIGSEPATRDWLPRAGAPATEQLLLGLPPGRGTDTLVLANPGEDEARAQLRVVTKDASFVPEGLDEIRVAPESVEPVEVSDTVREQLRKGALGLQVSATSPVTATLRSVVDGDLVHTTAVTGSSASMTGLVPPGDARLVLARAGDVGVAVVTAYDGGRTLATKRIELTEGSGGVVDLPKGTSLVRVRPSRTHVSAAVVTTGDGSTVVPLRELVRHAQIPAVRPGLP